MAQKSSIEWTQASWTPIRARDKATGKVGWHCERATTGCEFCYSEAFNMRLGTGLPFKPGHRKDIELFLDEEMLLAPLRWKKPRLIFVCSMTDLFADFVSEEWIRAVFTTMAQARHHTFQVLTKRASRMREVLTRWERAGLTLREGKGVVLPNVWLGVSAERQQEANERVLDLIVTPAAVRFVSAEPLLGAIDFTRIPSIRFHDKQPYEVDALKYPEARVDWMIVGGESGSSARPFDLAWARSIVSQCKAAGVACFVKQFGSHPVDSDTAAIKGADGKLVRLRMFTSTSKKGGAIEQWPPELRVREMPVTGSPREVAA